MTYTDNFADVPEGASPAGNVDANNVDANNVDPKTVASFGDEWAHFDQSDLGGAEAEDIFEGYFGIFPWEALPENATGFDMGVGSGRWAAFVAPRVGTLNCVDASPVALDVARGTLERFDNTAFHVATANDVVLGKGTQDFGYSLGVLHHIPDTPLALRGCTAMLKPGAPFLLYLYYRFDNRPAWFRGLWRLSEAPRALVSHLPSGLKPLATDTLAAAVYWPLARGAKLAEKMGAKVGNWPLSFYRKSSFYTMRTDSRDRFGTPLEQRFTRAEIRDMMEAAGLRDIVFSDREPFWVALGYKA